MVDLQGGVVDLVGAPQQDFEIPADIVAVAGGVYEDMRRQRRHARCDVPDVQVMHLRDTGSAGHCRSDHIRIKAAGAPSRKIRPDSLTRP